VEGILYRVIVGDEVATLVGLSVAGGSLLLQALVTRLLGRCAPRARRADPPAPDGIAGAGRDDLGRGHQASQRRLGLRAR
jgi:hypothetical protein